MHNLFLLGFWLILAAVLFLWAPLGAGPDPVLPIGALRVHMGWVALALAAFNLLRWWSVQSARPPRRVTPERPRRRDGGEYNPEFDFDREERSDQ